MRKEIGDWDTTVHLTDEEAKSICKLGHGTDVCAFLVSCASGFACKRMDSTMSRLIMERIDAGKMNAKGTGGWDGCAWPGYGYTSLSEEGAHDEI